MSDEKKMTLLDTIAPKSDQLNYDDVAVTPITDKVVGLKFGSPEQPVVVALEKHRDYKPCKSMRRVLIAAWGDEGRKWMGHSLTLVGDATVAFGGAQVGGIRISHLTGIDKPMTIKLTTTRSKRSDYTVTPLVIAAETVTTKEVK